MLALGELICRPFVLLTKSWWHLKMPGVWGSTAPISYLEDTGSWSSYEEELSYPHQLLETCWQL